MDVFVWQGVEVPVDDDGFIQEPECWNPDMATARSPRPMASRS